MSEMEYRQLGDSGLTVSTVGLGCNNFGRRLDAARTDAVVNAAVDAGITLFDTADVYHGEHGFSEELLGKALGDRRDEVVIATKFGGDMHGANGPDWGVRGSRRYIRKAVESSLQRLGTDWIDLYQLHVPDPVTPIEETLAALTELVAEGKVVPGTFYVGYRDWECDEHCVPTAFEASAKELSAMVRYMLELGPVAQSKAVPAPWLGKPLVTSVDKWANTCATKLSKDRVVREYGERFWLNDPSSRTLTSAAWGGCSIFASRN